MPASIRREIEDYEVPWPEKTEDDWRRIERRKTSGNANKDAAEEMKGKKSKGGNQDEERKEERNDESQLPERNRVSSKVRFQRVSDSSPTEVEEISSIARKSASYTIDRESEIADSLLDKPEWMQYKNAY